jgi:hypothetical protein
VNLQSLACETQLFFNRVFLTIDYRWMFNASGRWFAKPSSPQAVLEMRGDRRSQPLGLAATFTVEELPVKFFGNPGRKLSELLNSFFSRRDRLEECGVQVRRTSGFKIRGFYHLDPSLQ